MYIMRDGIWDDWMGWEKGYGMSWWDERKYMERVDGMRERVWDERNDMGWEKGYGMSVWDERKDMEWVDVMGERIWDEWMREMI